MQPHYGSSGSQLLQPAPLASPNLHLCHHPKPQGSLANHLEKNARRRERAILTAAAVAAAPATAAAVRGGTAAARATVAATTATGAVAATVAAWGATAATTAGTAVCK